MIGAIAPSVPVSNAPSTCGIPKADLPSVCAPKVDTAQFSKTGLMLSILSYDKGRKHKDCDMAILLAISVQDVHALVQASPLMEMTGNMVGLVGSCAAMAGAVAL